jgi:hypothetical protein
MNDPLSRHVSATKAQGKKAAANPLARKTIQVAGAHWWECVTFHNLAAANLVNSRRTAPCKGSFGGVSTQSVHSTVKHASGQHVHVIVA